MNIEEIGGIGSGPETIHIKEPLRGEKEPGSGNSFEEVRTNQLSAAEPAANPELDHLQYQDNLLSRSDAKQVQNDFLRQVQQAGEGKELEVLTGEIDRVRNQMEHAQQRIPAVKESGMSATVENYLTEAENRFNYMDQLTKELSSGDRQYSLQDLLKIQVQVQNISQNLEVLSKLVDKLTDGLKTVLRTQV